MLPFLKKREATEIFDVAILINDREIREIPVSQETEDAVYAGELVLPKKDTDVRYFPGGGRAFILGYKGDYLAESENIVRLERSTVLRNLFDYGASEKKGSMQFYIMMAVLVITIFLLRG